MSGAGTGCSPASWPARCAAVTGIDRDEQMIAVARERGRAVPGVSFVQADFLAYPLEDASFDFACANTALHHMDFGAALAQDGAHPAARRAARRGRAWRRDGSPADWAIGAAGIPANLWYKRTRGEGNPGAPIMEPDMTWSQVRSDRRPATSRRPLPPAPAVALLDRVKPADGCRRARLCRRPARRLKRRDGTARRGLAGW